MSLPNNIFSSLVMAFPLSIYSQVKDKFCLAYLGSEKEFVLQLAAARILLENEFKPLIIYLCCADKLMPLIKDEKRVVTAEEVKNNPKAFGYIRELKWNTVSNPVEDLLNESGVNWKKIGIEKALNKSEIHR